MLDEDETPQPKPLVDFIYLDDDEEKPKPDILDKYEHNAKFPFDFGKNRNLMNEKIKKEIHNYHKVVDPEEENRKQEKVKHTNLDNNRSNLNSIDAGDNNLNINNKQTTLSNFQNAALNEVAFDYESDILKKEDNKISSSSPKKQKKPKDKNKKDSMEVDPDYDIDAYCEESEASSDNDNSQNASDAEDSENEIENQIPVSHVVELEHTQGKAINSLDIDRSGNRLVTGCYDGTVKIWDFTSLTRRPAPFMTVDAGEGFAVLSVSWAPSGGFFLAATGDCQAKVYDRDGNYEIGCLKGDNYLHDISHTKGHTYPLTDGKWHPMERNIFITSARDSTIRLWDIYAKPMGIDQELMQVSILRARTFKNHKIPITCCNFSKDGKYIVGGVNDGSVQFFSTKNGYWKPDIYIPEAHEPNSEITSILFCEDNTRFFTRANDATLKMWDLRRAKKPVFTWDDIPCFSTRTGIALSPDENFVATGTSVKKGQDYSKINFYSTFNYEKVKELKVSKSSVADLIWNEKINQICVGSTDGLCRVYFNPNISKNGIVNSIYKKAKTKEIDDFEYAKPIITPLVLPLFDETNFNRKIYLEKINPEQEQQLKVELPVQGPGSKNARPPSVTQYIMQNIHKTIYKEGDPIEMLRKFAPKDKPGEWVDNAYKDTQPKPVFDYSAPLENEVVYYEQSKRKKCDGCGMKFCICKKSIFQLPIPKLSKPKPKE